MHPKERIVAFHDEMVAIRRDLHAHPEIGFEEDRTSAIVAAKLEDYGIEVHRGVGGTGVVGVLRAGNSPRSIGLRADMDALPIQEASNLPHGSRIPGRMHACGHDGHTTMLLGAARYLAETRAFSGTVHFIFQPAEEGLGGAKAMLAAGLFERFPCDAVFGMHNLPGLPIGQFSIRPGPMMAGGAFFDVRVTGSGSHGAHPEKSVDPVLAACHITAALQSVVARNVPPEEPAVVSVTAIHGGDAYNVIPQSATLRGTARCFSHATMSLIEQAIRRIAAGVAAGLGATAEVEFRLLFAPLHNQPAETELIAEAAAGLVGEAKVDRAQKIEMASEDFSFMLEQRPGAFINIGNGGSRPLHNPGYDFNDEIIPLGASLWASLVEAKLSRAVPA